MDFGERIARLEGGQSTLVGAVAIVSAILLGAMGLLLSMMLDLQSQTRDLANRVESLPSEINSNLIELNRTLSEAITAARSGERPQVVIIDRSDTQPEE